MADKNLKVKVKADFDEYTKGLKKAGNETTSFKDKLASVGKKAAAAFLIVGTALIAAAKRFADFEKDFTSVVTLLDKDSFKNTTLEQGVKNLEQGVLDLRRTTGESFADINKALFDYISATGDADGALQALKAATDLAAAGNTNISVAIDGVTTSMNAYGDAVGDAENISSLLFTAQKAGKTTIEELSSSLGKVVPTAAALGISFEEILASTSALTLKGIKTTEAMTGLKASFANIVKPTADATAEADRLGIQFDQSALQADGLQGFLQKVIVASDGNKESLTKLFGSIEAVNTVFALTSNSGAKFTEILGKLNDKQQVTATYNDAVTTATETTDKAINRIIGTFDILVVKLGQYVAPVITAFANLLENGVNIITDWRNKLSSAEGAFKKITESLKEITLALAKALNRIINRIIGTFDMLIVKLVRYVAPAITAFANQLEKGAKIITYWSNQLFGAAGSLEKIKESLNEVTLALAENRHAQKEAATAVEEANFITKAWHEKRLLQLQEEAEALNAKRKKLQEDLALQREQQIDHDALVNEQDVADKAVKQAKMRAAEDMKTATLQTATSKRAEILAKMRAAEKINDEAEKLQQMTLLKQHLTQVEIEDARNKVNLTQAAIKFAKEEADREAKNKAQFLRDQLEHGTAYAKLNQFFGDKRAEILAKMRAAEKINDEAEKLQQMTLLKQHLTQVEIEDARNKVNLTQAAIKFAKEEADREAKNKAQFLRDQLEHGTAYAKLNQFFGDKRVQGSMKIGRDLSSLQSSENKDRAALGRAAAKIMIVIDAAQAIMKSYAQLGPIGGSIAAGAMALVSHEQLRAIDNSARGAASGGIVRDGIVGRDTEPFMLAKNEAIIPADITPALMNTFNELRRIREYGSLQASLQTGSNGLLQSTNTANEQQPVSINVNLDLNNEADKFIRASLNERDQLNI